ncbi:hypothetical protein GQR58_023086 [Nymphon striatum]|nr:hypothetical protein GQR58_023086 [Nymphon striatum]
MVIEHIKNNLQLSFNDSQNITLGKGDVRLGHETKVVFQVFGIPSDIKSVLVKSTVFDDIHRSQSALVLLKEGFNKEQFVLNDANNHTMELQVNGNEFAEVEENNTITITAEERIMVTNSLPNHATGEFPNPGNPNTISAQNRTFSFPLHPKYKGKAQWIREPGIALNGIKFEPGTAEVVVCESGENYRVEAFQDIIDMGLDFNNAHVQPTGAYHYHGSPSGVIENFDSGEDLVHIGFAHDGFPMYYSKSNAYKPSFKLLEGKREGEDCNYSRPGQSIAIPDKGHHDGSFGSDYEYVEDSGDLDECNGITIDDQYMYLVTNEFPYVSRCLMGEFESQERGGPPQGSGQAGRGPGGERPSKKIWNNIKEQDQDHNLIQKIFNMKSILIVAVLCCLKISGAESTALSSVAIDTVLTDENVSYEFSEDANNVMVNISTTDEKTIMNRTVRKKIKRVDERRLKKLWKADYHQFAEYGYYNDTQEFNILLNNLAISVSFTYDEVEGLFEYELKLPKTKINIDSGKDLSKLTIGVKTVKEKKKQNKEGGLNGNLGGISLGGQQGGGRSGGGQGGPPGGSRGGRGGQGGQGGGPPNSD